eukprot:31346-Pelagococcus_subviridis.AAC.17
MPERDFAEDEEEPREVRGVDFFHAAAAAAAAVAVAAVVLGARKRRGDERPKHVPGRALRVRVQRVQRRDGLLRGGVPPAPGQRRARRENLRERGKRGRVRRERGRGDAHGIRRARVSTRARALQERRRRARERGLLLRARELEHARGVVDVRSDDFRVLRGGHGEDGERGRLQRVLIHRRRLRVPARHADARRLRPQRADQRPVHRDAVLADEKLDYLLQRRELAERARGGDVGDGPRRRRRRLRAGEEEHVHGFNRGVPHRGIPGEDEPQQLADALVRAVDAELLQADEEADGLDRVRRRRGREELAEDADGAAHLDGESERGFQRGDHGADSLDAAVELGRCWGDGVV